MSKHIKIYTKRGDKGKTDFQGKRIYKHDLRIEIVGTIDELSSSLGLLRAFLPKEKKEKELKEEEHEEEEKLEENAEERIKKIQERLIDIGAYFSMNYKVNLKDELEKLESHIDEYDSKLPTLRQFIIPGEDKASSFAHLARVIVRRLERLLCKYFNSLDKEGEGKEKEEDTNCLIAYTNRLSDFLFVFARTLSNKEVRYKRGRVTELYK